ncbi:hypothetical protein ABIA32_006245 [Streptacidiphilus sp. MAP12-20]|uniref:carbohydrate binding domain-containing protein n=1 Tax=Streptacidiphilus sp. MAP12-20 TaxID=3156299 RepID=UPI00351423F5
MLERATVQDCRPTRSRRGSALAAAAALLAAGSVSLMATAGGASAATTNLLSNPGFETGNLSGWSCDSLGTVVSTPVHSGGYSLQGAASASDDAQCTQTVAVQPNTTYNLSGYVEGNYVYLGVTGSGTTDTSSWTASAPSWTQLTDTFTTGASTTSVQVYVHGWYAEGSYHADDLSLTGGSGSTGSASPSSSPSSSSTPSPTASASASASPTPTSSSSSGSGTYGAFSPYTDLSVWPTFDLASGATTEGTKYFNLAFITDGGSCTPMWGGVTAITDSATATNIANLRAKGGDVRVSFGGASGTELALNCTSASALAAAYQQVITQYGLKYIDFDVEGAAISDTASIGRRNQAIAILEKNNPGLKVSYTLPVLPTGLTTEGVAVLTSAKSNGASLAAVNIMAMDYGASFSSDMGQNAIDAATTTESQIKSVWTTLSDSQAWGMVAVTPMIGLNDDTSETFTVANATTLVNFAKTKHLAWLSFWSATRDKQCSAGAVTYTDATCSSILQSSGAFGQAMSAYTG